MKIQDIDAGRLAFLHRGEGETATLVECLALDFGALLRGVLPGEVAGAEELDRQRGSGISKRMALGGQILFERLDAPQIAELGQHRSDTVRGWACYAVAAEPGLSLGQRLERIRVFADDSHFGVREWAWLAVRPHIAAELKLGISLLAEWTESPSERVRRFAAEATRPRGVWSAHLAELKVQPELGLAILEPLRADGSKYVQDSVGNWLNDAAKSQPDWVRGVCERWLGESASAATQRICARAQRSL